MSADERRYRWQRQRRDWLLAITIDAGTAGLWTVIPSARRLYTIAFNGQVIGRGFGLAHAKRKVEGAAEALMHGQGVVPLTTKRRRGRVMWDSARS